MSGIGVITADRRAAIARTFHTLVLQPTNFCNLDCTYCYLPDRQSRRLRTVPVTAGCARSVKEQASPYPVSVVWHGGEPTTTPLGTFRERAGRLRFIGGAYVPFVFFPTQLRSYDPSLRALQSRYSTHSSRSAAHQSLRMSGGGLSGFSATTGF